MKWPIALYMLISLPAYIQSLSYFNFTQFKYIAFGGGSILFILSMTMSDGAVRTGLQTIAHELTHTFFAFITFHKIKHVRLNPDDSGGSMGFEGEGNWLITISPYFFPLFVFFFMILVGFFPSHFIINGILGYLMGYHIDTVASQIHDKQTDLPKVGYGFCWTFLPGANFWIIGCILSFNSRGWEGISVYQTLIYNLNLKNLEFILKMLFGS